MAKNDTEHRNNRGGENLGEGETRGGGFGEDPRGEEAQPGYRLLKRIGVNGDDVLDTGKRVLAWGNVRRVVVRYNSKVVARIPLTVGIIAALLAPRLVAFGVLATIITGASIEVHQEETTE